MMVKMKDPSTNVTLYVAEANVEKFESLGFVRVAEKQTRASKPAAKK